MAGWVAEILFCEPSRTMVRPPVRIPDILISKIVAFPGRLGEISHSLKDVRRLLIELYHAIALRAGSLHD